MGTSGLVPRRAAAGGLAAGHLAGAHQFGPAAGLDAAAGSATLAPGGYLRRQVDELVAVRAGLAGLQCRGPAGGLRAAAPAGRAAAQSGGHGGHFARLGLQHRHQLCEQHQLARLWRRIQHELPDADAGAGGAELSVCGHRHRRGVRAVSRICRARHRGHRQLLGRCDAHHRLAAAAAVAGVRFVSGGQRRDPEFRRLQGCGNAGNHELSAAQKWP
ncbi:hypothetical protein POHY109586_22555 [Polaromonas hydrogenivorans]